MLASWVGTASRRFLVQSRGILRVVIVPCLIGLVASNSRLALQLLQLQRFDIDCFGWGALGPEIKMTCCKKLLTDNTGDAFSGLSAPAAHCTIPRHRQCCHLQTPQRRTKPRISAVGKISDTLYSRLEWSWRTRFVHKANNMSRLLLLVLLACIAAGANAQAGGKNIVHTCELGVATAQGLVIWVT